jgi:hypothetical protein
MIMDELHKLFLGMIAVLIVFTIMFGTVAGIQKHNQSYLKGMSKAPASL